LHIPAPAAGHFAYHVRMAAVYALADSPLESAAESVLAWALLSNQWSGAESAAVAVANELIDQHSAGVSDAAQAAALARARGLALDIEAHHVSVGCFDEATLYASVADSIGDAIAALVAR
jgi:hypothetical protein